MNRLGLGPLEREPQEPQPREFNTFAVRRGHDNWFTPQDFGEKLDQEFDLQDWDPCPLGAANDLRRWMPKESPEWVRRYRMNPPYSRCQPWLQLAREEQRKSKLVVVILRGDTSTVWYHELVYPYAESRLVRGRVRFGGKGPAPFATLVAIFRPGEVGARTLSVMRA